MKLFSKLAIALAIAMMSVVAFTAQPSAEATTNLKVKVCHATGSESNPWVKIEVSLNALPAHLAHGDVFPNFFTGKCPTPPPPHDECENLEGNQPEGFECYPPLECGDEGYEPNPADECDPIIEVCVNGQFVSFPTSQAPEGTADCGRVLVCSEGQYVEVSEFTAPQVFDTRDCNPVDKDCTTPVCAPMVEYCVDTDGNGVGDTIVVQPEGAQLPAGAITTANGHWCIPVTLPPVEVTPEAPVVIAPPSAGDAGLLVERDQLLIGGGVVIAAVVMFMFAFGLAAAFGLKRR